MVSFVKCIILKLKQNKSGIVYTYMYSQTSFSDHLY